MKKVIFVFLMFITIESFSQDMVVVNCNEYPTSNSLLNEQVLIITSNGRFYRNEFFERTKNLTEKQWEIYAAQINADDYTGIFGVLSAGGFTATQDSLMKFHYAYDSAKKLMKIEYPHLTAKEIDSKLVNIISCCDKKTNVVGEFPPAPGPCEDALSVCTANADDTYWGDMGDCGALAVACSTVGPWGSFGCGLGCIIKAGFNLRTANRNCKAAYKTCKNK